MKTRYSPKRQEKFRSKGYLFITRCISVCSSIVQYVVWMILSCGNSVLLFLTTNLKVACKLAQREAELRELAFNPTWDCFPLNEYRIKRKERLKCV